MSPMRSGMAKSSKLNRFCPKSTVQRVDCDDAVCLRWHKDRAHPDLGITPVAIEHINWVRDVYDALISHTTGDEEEFPH
jgi:hypothetical protein